MAEPRDVIAQWLPRKMIDGKVSLNLDRADKILDELKKDGSIILSSEIAAVIRYTIDMLVTADKLNVEDRQRIAESGISTVWGGFFPLKATGD